MLSKEWNEGAVYQLSDEQLQDIYTIYQDNMNKMAEEYGITSRKTASILDTFSAVSQGIIPYGAQMLVAISAAHELGYDLSAFQIMPKLFYPILLLFSSLVFIFLVPQKERRDI